jgi:hypothetical protein
MPGENAPDTGMESLLERISVLESRISKMEEQLSGRRNTSGAEEDDYRLFARTKRTDPGAEVDEAVLESRIGEHGLAWLGSIVLFFGIAFLMSFIAGHGQLFLSALLGYGSVACIFLVSVYLKRSLPHMVFMFHITGHLLLFYTTLRLYFFTAHPLVPFKGVVFGLLIIVLGAQLFLAFRRKAEWLSGISLVLALSTALITDSLHLSMPLITATALASLFLYYRFGWWRLMIVTLCLVYLVHMIWLLNNPLLGKPLQIVSSDPNSTIYLFLCGLTFSLAALIRPRGPVPVTGVNALILLNAISFSVCISLATAIFYPAHYVAMFALISGFCLLFSVVLKVRTGSVFTPSFFACFGFMAMSVSVYGFAGLPEAYFFLSLQSLLVVSMALWFRSRIIVVVNSVLYAGILLVYLLTSQPVNRISFSFAIVAFATARILNWRKEKLTLKTDLLRNFYLFALFLTLLYAMYHLVPGRYVTLSWTAVAAGYFILSMILRNIKYRWMAMATLLVTGVYLFVVDLAQLEVGYRVLAFLFLALISISASVYYTKKIRKKRGAGGEEARPA